MYQHLAETPWRLYLKAEKDLKKVSKYMFGNV
jgi:hypothetical protein